MAEVRVVGGGGGAAVVGAAGNLAVNHTAWVAGCPVVRWVRMSLGTDSPRRVSFKGATGLRRAGAGRMNRSAITPSRERRTRRSKPDKSGTAKAKRRGTAEIPTYQT